MKDADIYFTLGSAKSVLSFQKYSHPLVLRKSAQLVCYAQNAGGQKSKTVRAVFTRFTPPGKITLNTPYSAQYTAGGSDALIDGRRGNTDFRLGAWQGYEGNDLDAVIDLGDEKSIVDVSLGCLQDNNSWIFFPRQVEFTFSDDGVKYGNDVTIMNDVSQKDERILIKEFGHKFEQMKARFVRIHAANVGICPDWHKGAGQKAWLFVDEITVRTK